VWDGVALPVAQAVVAHAQGRFDAAANLLAPQLSQLWRIGGSHAQRDVFVQTWIDAALKAGHTSAAMAMLSQRAKERPGAPVARRLLAHARAAEQSMALAS